MTAEELALRCAALAQEKLAQDVVALDLRGISTFTDFFVICSGASEPQLKAIAGGITDTLRQENGIEPNAVDGYPLSQWLVVDYGSVVVHVFHQVKRELYSLEDLWSDAPRLQLPG
jgi:ribosome-associated protein